MYRKLTTIAAACAGLLAMTAHAAPPLLTQMPPAPPKPSLALPDPDAPIYSADPKVECAIAIAALWTYHLGPIDPLLRGDTGDVDCGNAIQAAGIATQPFISGRHFYATRPVLAPNGKPYIVVQLGVGRFHQSAGYFAEQQDGHWIVDEPVVMSIT